MILCDTNLTANGYTKINLEELILNSIQQLNIKPKFVLYSKVNLVLVAKIAQIFHIIKI